MRIDEIQIYKCPNTGNSLVLDKGAKISDGIVSNGKLSSTDGTIYKIKNGVPDFTFPLTLNNKDQESREDYDSIAEEYNHLQHVTFDILCQKEDEVRQDMIESLNLNPDNYILETAAGTGLNFSYIIEALHGKGHIVAQDISAGMIQKAKRSFERNDSYNGIEFSYSIGNAAYLPYQDNFFDAAFSFGGIGVFNEKERAIHEMCRVVKPGGRVVFGDEGVAPWLRKSEFGKILIDNNQFYLNETPISLLPIEAREVNVRWIMGGAFYLVEFTVGIDEPEANFDYEIPGSRGGTLNTRYYGKLEGVNPKTKEIAQKAQKKSGKSMHEWLDEVVYKASLKILKD